MKIPFVAAVTLATHNLKPELSAEVLKKASDLLQKHIDSGSWREVKLLIRFLGSLQAIFEGDGIFPLLEEFFARAADLQSASSEDVSSSLYPSRLLLDSNSFKHSFSVWNSSKSSCSPSRM